MKKLKEFFVDLSIYFIDIISDFTYILFVPIYKYYKHLTRCRNHKYIASYKIVADGFDHFTQYVKVCKKCVFSAYISFEEYKKEIRINKLNRCLKVQK